MKALKIFLGIFIFFLVAVLIVVLLAFNVPVELEEYNTNVDLQEQLLSLAVSSSGSRISVSEKLLNEVAGSILADQLGNINFESTPVSFGGMNIFLNNGILSVYGLLNFEHDSFIPSWIKRVMISGQFEIKSDNDIITVTLKKVKLGVIPLPVKIIVVNLLSLDFPDAIDIQNLLYTISYSDLSNMVSEDISISMLEIENQKLSFFINLNSAKMTEIVDILKPLIIKSEEIISQQKENTPFKYMGMVEDGALVMDILRDSIESQKANKIPTAYISWYEGDVTIQYPDTEETALVDLGMDIIKGSIIKTGINSHVEIVLPDRSLLILQSDTIVVLEEMYFEGKNGTVKTTVSLGVGRVRSIVKKMVTNESFYEIKTPSGTAGVRGTDFGVSCSANDKNIDIIVLSGTINLKNTEGDELIMGSDTIASVDKKGKLSKIKVLNFKTRMEFIQQLSINTLVSEGAGNKFPTLLPIILRILRTWDTLSYEEQQEFISIMNKNSELESLLKDFDFEGIQGIIPNQT